MPKDRVNRREFMGRTMRIVAAAAGLSMAELSEILATDFKQLKPKQRPRQSQKYSVYQKSANREIKALKVLIENNKAVFENEYGRTTPPRQQFIPDIGRTGNVCGSHFMGGGVGGPLDGCGHLFMGVGGQCPVLGIGGGENTCDGQCVGVGAGPSGCNGVHLTDCGTNKCPRQDCGNLIGCGTNDCSGQKCPKQKSCDKNKQIMLSPTLFEHYKSDPYVRHLMERFNVTNSSALANQVQNMLRQRRGMMQRHIHPPRLPEGR